MDAYSRFSTLGTTTVPSGSRKTKNICLIGSLIVSEKADQPEWNRGCPRFLRFQRSDLYVIKGRHKISSDLSPFSLVMALGEFC
jgi:hypothetical protein